MSSDQSDRSPPHAFRSRGYKTEALAALHQTPKPQSSRKEKLRKRERETPTLRRAPPKEDRKSFPPERATDEKAEPLRARENSTEKKDSTPEQERESLKVMDDFVMCLMVGVMGSDESVTRFKTELDHVVKSKPTLSGRIIVRRCDPEKDPPLDCDMIFRVQNSKLTSSEFYDEDDTEVDRYYSVTGDGYYCLDDDALECMEDLVIDMGVSLMFRYPRHTHPHGMLMYSHVPPTPNDFFHKLFPQYTKLSPRGVHVRIPNNVAMRLIKGGKCVHTEHVPPMNLVLMHSNLQKAVLTHKKNGGWCINSVGATEWVEDDECDFFLTWELSRVVLRRGGDPTLDLKAEQVAKLVALLEDWVSAVVIEHVAGYDTLVREQSRYMSAMSISVLADFLATQPGGESRKYFVDLTVMRIEHLRHDYAFHTRTPFMVPKTNTRLRDLKRTNPGHFLLWQASRALGTCEKTSREFDRLTFEEKVRLRAWDDGHVSYSCYTENKHSDKTAQCMIDMVLSGDSAQKSTPNAYWIVKAVRALPHEHTEQAPPPGVVGNRKILVDGRAGKLTFKPRKVVDRGTCERWEVNAPEPSPFTDNPMWSDVYVNSDEESESEWESEVELTDYDHEEDSSSDSSSDDEATVIVDDTEEEEEEEEEPPAKKPKRVETVTWSDDDDVFEEEPPKNRKKVVRSFRHQTPPPSSTPVYAHRGKGKPRQRRRKETTRPGEWLSKRKVDRAPVIAELKEMLEKLQHDAKDAKEEFEKKVGELTKNAIEEWAAANRVEAQPPVEPPTLQNFTTEGSMR